MRPADVPVAERLTAESYYELDTRTFSPHWPAPVLRPEARSGGWVTRTTHVLTTDPSGCWVAEDDSGLLGVAISLRRELLWALSSFAVRPGLQGQGIGRPLLEAAMTHSRGCLRGMLSASSDPKALRRYTAAGFRLHPQMWLYGAVDRSTLPVVEKVREGSAADIELMDSLDRRTRGAAHGPDHELLLSTTRLQVSDTGSGSGYVYSDPGGGPLLLAASNRRTAARLMWAVLADAEDPVTVSHVSGANDWAVAVGMAARLDLHQSGYLALRGMKPPAPYVHHGALL
jgi:GNAT superfamily N-acetyltransferase